LTASLPPRHVEVEARDLRGAKIDPKTRDRVTAAALQFPLDRGEKQLWAGAPRLGVVFRSTDVFMIPFTLLWGGFAVFWEATVARTKAPGFFLLFGGVFVLVGMYITVGRFIADAIRRGRTVYAVTSERVIIVTGLFTPETKSLSLATLTDVTLTERSDGSGTITFGPTPYLAGMYVGTPWPGVPRVPSLEMIPQARGVYDIIRTAQQALRTRAG
jgi:Bacterial PH domain